MAKFTGIRIRLGAAHDEVATIKDGEVQTAFDRAEMRKLGAHKSQGTLRRGVVEAWTEGRDERKERADKRDRQRKQARRHKHSSRHEAA